MISSQIEEAVKKTNESIRKQIFSRAVRVSNELLNAEKNILRGQRHGRMYRVPFTRRHYQASAPGEAPAVRLGMFRMSWKPNPHADGDLIHGSIESRLKTSKGPLLGELLEEGTGRMAPRPYKQAILDQSIEKARQIYGEPYTR